MTTSASPIQIQNNAPSFKAQADVEYADGKTDFNLELTTYASPSQVETNVPALRTRGYVDDSDDDLNEDVSIAEIPVGKRIGVQSSARQ